MNVSLTPQLEKLIQDKVNQGLYHSASEVIREGLRLLAERDQLRQLRLKELRRQVRHGVAQLDRGERAPLDTDAIKREGRRRHKSRRKGRG